MPTRGRLCTVGDCVRAGGPSSPRISPGTPASYNGQRTPHGTRCRGVRAGCHTDFRCKDAPRCLPGRLRYSGTHPARIDREVFFHRNPAGPALVWVRSFYLNIFLSNNMHNEGKETTRDAVASGNGSLRSQGEPTAPPGKGQNTARPGTPDRKRASQTLWIPGGPNSFYYPALKYYLLKKVAIGNQKLYDSTDFSWLPAWTGLCSKGSLSVLFL